MVLSPVFDGAVQLTAADALPAVAATPVGAPGTDGPVGVTAFDDEDAGPVPLAFVAVTVKVYAVPFVRPVTVVDVPGGLPVSVTAVCAVGPANGVTVYLVIELPPLFDGAVQLTVADWFPAVAVTPVGAPGKFVGVTLFDGDEAALVPLALVAVTANVYAVPLVSPDTVVDVAGGLPVTVTAV
jgi:hypothetical protein